MQHDDHCWVTVYGGNWCIRRIVRRADGGWEMELWRGYAPALEYTTIIMDNFNTALYAETAASWLRHKEG